MIRTKRMKQAASGRIYRGVGKPLDPLKAGQGRCPCCRRALKLTSYGRMRKHSDRAGAPCGGGGMEPSAVAS